MDEDSKERKLRLNRENNKRWRTKQKEQNNSRYLKKQAERMATRRSRETRAETEKRRASCLKNQLSRNKKMTEEERKKQKTSNLLSQTKRLKNQSKKEADIRIASERQFKINRQLKESSEERVLRLKRHSQAQDRYRSRQLSQFQQSFQMEINESNIETHNCGQLNVICIFCKSKNFKDETPKDGKFTSCCRKGRVKLEVLTDENHNPLEYPEFLRQMLTNPNNPNYKNLRENIRSYNSAISFASMGANIVNSKGNGPYIFKVHGQIYHRTSHLETVNDASPKFAQLYVLDTSQATDIRLENPANINCDRNILKELDNFMRSNNRLAFTYQMLKEIENNAQKEAIVRGSTIPIINMALRRDRQSDTTHYNTPTSNEIAMIFVNNDGEPPFERDIRIYPKNPKNSQPFININILSPNLEPMVYPILCPYGEPGWQPDWTCESYDGSKRNKVRNKISKLQYVAAQCAIRDTFNPKLRAGKLTQQWIVDSYLQIEANNLNFFRQNQKKLRAENYKKLTDHNVAQNCGGVKAGVPVILPSSFEGSPRNKRERSADAMSIFSKFGAPDLFITFTANPLWNEIKENLFEGESYSDRPDLVVRLFKLKLKSLLNDLTIFNLLGVSVAHVYTIEFKKRGLPHAHILITLREEDKFTSVARINQIVSAEIPDEEQNPKLREIVLRFMIHGPCGAKNPTASCMDNNKCKKLFPKEFQEVTIINHEGYPKYRRSEGASIEIRNRIINNQYVVPYNPHLLLKYNAHINVEVSASLKVIKYIYKYIYKGFNCCNIQLNQENRQDEILKYINARYISDTEAMWRILELKMHDRSHAIIRLPVHLPNQQKIFFEEGREKEALIDHETRQTKLEAWFLLNKNDKTANKILYSNIPYHYTFSNGSWKPRKLGAKKLVSRIYTVSPKDEERFYLRLLLLHVTGATSFVDLRTVNNNIYDTFKEAAFQRNLIESDHEWDNCLLEATTYKMPKQLRQMFGFICVFCKPENSLQLWDKYNFDLTIDYASCYDEEEAKNWALYDINTTLMQFGFTCSSFNLPDPTINKIELDQYIMKEEKIESESKIKSLNQSQLQAFNKIILSLEQTNMNKSFFIDGPGGSGKTYLYTTLLTYFRGRGEIALPFATTGIAATLLKGGRTVHSGFKLPVPLLETSVSNMRLNTPEADSLKRATLIIVDEVSMLTNNELRCIDRLLKDIMNNDLPFGGKVFVIGGDFRQTLPVIPMSTKTEILENCIKFGSLWHHFEKLTLISNMRSEQQQEFNNWLLDVGNGDLPNADQSIIIPNEMISKTKLIDAVYGDPNNLPIEEISKRIILTPTNKKTLQMNKEVINKMYGELHTYNSSDSIISEDSSDYKNFPIEFLHELTPSGMPPHILELKIGIPILLLRNLSPKNGLCNGTRLIIKSLYLNFIAAEIISENKKGGIVFIPRVDLATIDSNLPFTLKRRQFPIIPAYSITINKSQGQTFEYVGIYLQEPVFAHGQLYVALSRCKFSSQIKISIKKSQLESNKFKKKLFKTKNIVYKEVLEVN